MSAKHSLVEIYLARMLILGAGSLCWIAVCGAVLVHLGGTRPGFLPVYLCVPYLFSASLSLWLCRRLGRGSETIGCAAAACAVSAGYCVLQGSFDIYADRLRPVWLALFVMLTALCAWQLARQNQTWEDLLCN